MHFLLVDLPLWLAFVVALLACWALTLFALPGNWLIVLVAALVAWLAPEESRLRIAPAVLAMLVVLALVGEAFEFAAGSVATRRAGGTRRGAVAALLGAFIGACAGAVIGVPIPIVGSAVAAVLGGAFGALVGAMLGEAHAGRSGEQSWRVGLAAFWGRLCGTLGKAIVGGLMVVIAALAAAL